MDRGRQTTPVWRLLAAMAIVLVGSCTDSGRGGTDVVIAVPSSSLVSTTVFVAEDLGLFSDEGLQVVVRHIVGVGSVNAVLAGSADFTVGTGSTLLRAVSQGQRFLVVANMVDRPMVELVLRRDLAQRLAVSSDTPLAARGRLLKGLTIGIQGVGSVVHAWARYVASLGGLDVEQDVRMIPMDPPAMAAALESGQIDGYTSSPPFTTAPVESGQAVMLASGLTDAPDLVPFGYLLLYAKPDTCVRRRDICVRLVRAFASASRIVAERPDDVLDKVLRKRFPTMNDRLLTAAWQRTRLAHAASVGVDERQFANSQTLSLAARLLKPDEALASFGSLYTNEFAR